MHIHVVPTKSTWYYNDGRRECYLHITYRKPLEESLVAVFCPKYPYYQEKTYVEWLWEFASVLFPPVERVIGAFWGSRNIDGQRTLTVWLSSPEHSRVNWVVYVDSHSPDLLNSYMELCASGATFRVASFIDVFVLYFWKKIDDKWSAQPFWLMDRLMLARHYEVLFKGAYREKDSLVFYEPESNPSNVLIAYGNRHIPYVQLLQQEIAGQLKLAPQAVCYHGSSGDSHVFLTPKGKVSVLFTHNEKLEKRCHSFHHDSRFLSQYGSLVYLILKKVLHSDELKTSSMKIDDERYFMT